MGVKSSETTNTAIRDIYLYIRLGDPANFVPTFFFMNIFLVYEILVLVSMPAAASQGDLIQSQMKLLHLQFFVLYKPCPDNKKHIKKYYPMLCSRSGVMGEYFSD